MRLSATGAWRWRRWITDPRNPLPARVMVNRLWQYHFGRGIVTTPGDFGHMGAGRRIPELLDWLASEFIAEWLAYQADPSPDRSVSHLPPVERAELRRACRGFRRSLLWRYPPRRLEAEPIRDSILQSPESFNWPMGGPGYDVFEPNSNYVRVYIPKEEFGPAEWRRMVYQFKPRLQQEPTFGVFDCPDGGQVTPKRTTSTTPLQALNLMNSSFMMQQATFFAERLRNEAGDDPGRTGDARFPARLRPRPDCGRARCFREIHPRPGTRPVLPDDLQRQ